MARTRTSSPKPDSAISEHKQLLEDALLMKLRALKAQNWNVDSSVLKLLAESVKIVQDME